MSHLPPPGLPPGMPHQQQQQQQPSSNKKLEKTPEQQRLDQKAQKWLAQHNSKYTNKRKKSGQQQKQPKHDMPPEVLRQIKLDQGDMSNRRYRKDKRE